jgi:hypothetical protein
MFAIQPEVYYSMQGAKYEEEEDDVQVKVIFKYDYIQVPVLAKVNIPIESSIKPNVFLGPALGINVRARCKKFSYSNNGGVFVLITLLYKLI